MEKKVKCFYHWGLTTRELIMEMERGGIKEKVLKWNKLRKLIKMGKVGDIGEKSKKNLHLSTY
jgi:hypothetical protein